MIRGGPAAIETFRDPAGTLSIEGDTVRRRVDPSRAQPALDFLDSELARAWVAQGLLVATTFAGEDGGFRMLEHPRIFFPTYSWEWTPSAWSAAAGLTLDLCEALLGRGLILKDATPLNVLFDGTRPVFVDVLSIDRRDPRSPLWLAYAQFVRTFLLPLAAYRYLGWPLAASLSRRDGYEPGDLYPYLSATRRWSAPMRSLVTLPYVLEKRERVKGRGAAGESAQAAALHQPPEVAEAVLRRNLHGLRTALRKLAPVERESRWSDYPESADHYAGEDHRQKQAFLRQALQTCAPHQVLDLGANTGVYSRIAASMGANVVAWDTDMAATERNWAQAASDRLPIQPILADAARPTPAVGWRNAEGLSLLDRTRGRFDCVLMLGLIHHLLIADQIPLAQVAGLLRELTTHWAIVEWVPATDPRFGDLVRGRGDLYGHLNEEQFAATMEQHFRVALKEPLKNGRTLYLLEAR
jgi:2-polyprenyl-3-methyl-5-hydroxy-6-metoxy-1,4-benzoquinol methylase